MESNQLIKLDGIGKSYTMGKNKVIVLNNITVTFGSGCFSVIAGPSGSGKSTLLNILGCLDQPDSGTYYLNDFLVDFKKKKKFAKIRKDNFGFVFQSFNLIPVLSAKENVELPMHLHDYTPSERNEISMEILNLVGLGDKMDNKPSELSGGQQQRVAIARAIATRPKVVFADEPTANLDRKSAENIVGLMQRLNEDQGISFVFASHDETVIGSAKELYTIENGKLAPQQKPNSTILIEP